MTPDARFERLLSLWVPVGAWAALLFALSSRSDLPPAPPHVTDKMIHAAAYEVLGATIVRALAGAAWHRVTVRTAALAVLLATAYGVTDELHQSLVPMRSVEVADVAADLAGASLAAALALGMRCLADRRRRAGSTTDGPAGRI